MLYCEKVTRFRKLSLGIAALSQNTAALADNLGTVLGKWHESVHFSVYARTILFFSNYLPHLFQSIFATRL